MAPGILCLQPRTRPRCARLQPWQPRTQWRTRPRRARLQLQRGSPWHTPSSTSAETHLRQPCSCSTTGGSPMGPMNRTACGLMNGAPVEWMVGVHLTETACSQSPSTGTQASATGFPVAFQRLSAYFPHGSRFHHWLAGSPETPGRNGFVILRTGRSPPVALHPASQRRSYSRLQAVAFTWRGLTPL